MGPFIFYLLKFFHLRVHCNIAKKCATMGPTVQGCAGMGSAIVCNHVKNCKLHTISKLIFMPSVIVCNHVQFKTRATRINVYVGMENIVCKGVQFYAFQIPCHCAIVYSYIQSCATIKSVIGMA